MLAINAADDERNPPETGITEHALKRIMNAKLLVIPASPNTAGQREALRAATSGVARHRA